MGEEPEAPDPTTLFHRLNSVLPKEQEVVSVGPDTPLADAIELMERHGYSQLPIVEGNAVLGAFTYRSFARVVLEMGRGDLGDLPVEAFADRLRFARPQDDFEEIIEWLDEDGAVFVGDPDRLVGIATTVDVLRYLLGIANVYVLLQEIELALRGLLRLAAEGDTPPTWMTTCLSTAQPGSVAPESFEDMSFGHYLEILQPQRNWERFEQTFGRARRQALSRLRQVNEIRNIAFHFRRPVAAEDYETLADTRDWLFRRIRIVRERRSGS